MINREHSKVFENGILAFLTPAGTGNTVLVGLLDTSGVARKSQKKPKEASVGTCMALQLYAFTVCIYRRETDIRKPVAGTR